MKIYLKSGKSLNVPYKRTTSKRIHAAVVESCRSADGLPLSADSSIPLDIAKPNGNDVVAWSRQEGTVSRPAGRPSLFAVVRKVDFRLLKRWALRELVALGQASDAPEDYPNCLVVEIKGDGASLKRVPWIVELWHTVPKMRVVS